MTTLITAAGVIVASGLLLLVVGAFAAPAVTARVCVAIGAGAYLAGWVTWKWCTGAQWRHHCQGRRYVTQQVRGTLQTSSLVVAGLLIWQPLIVASVLAAAGLALVATAGGMRLRQHRAAIATAPAVVTVGPVIPHRPNADQPARQRALEAAR